MGLLYTACCTTFRSTLRAFADWSIYGRENVPARGAFIVVANHQSNMDPPLVGASLGRQAWFLAKSTLFSNPLYSAFLRTYGAFPVKRDGTDLQASLWALRRLEREEPLVLFPEGTRSRGQMKRATPGVALLAYKAQVPILPIGITGTERMGSPLRVFYPTGNITVSFGEPFTLPSVQGRLGRNHLTSATELIMCRVAALLPARYRGVYGEKEAGREELPSPSPANQGQD